MTDTKIDTWPPKDLVITDEMAEKIREAVNSPLTKAELKSIQQYSPYQCQCCHCARY